jgi:hypothetical protein
MRALVQTVWDGRGASTAGDLCERVAAFARALTAPKGKNHAARTLTRYPNSIAEFPRGAADCDYLIACCANWRE